MVGASLTTQCWKFDKQPLGFLASQPSLPAQLQTKERPCQKMDCVWGTSPEVDSGLHMLCIYTYTKNLCLPGPSTKGNWDFLSSWSQRNPRSFWIHCFSMNYDLVERHNGSMFPTAYSLHITVLIANLEYFHNDCHCVTLFLQKTF